MPGDDNAKENQDNPFYDNLIWYMQAMFHPGVLSWFRLVWFFVVFQETAAPRGAHQEVHKGWPRITAGGRSPYLAKVNSVFVEENVGFWIKAINMINFHDCLFVYVWFFYPKVVLLHVIQWHVWCLLLSQALANRQTNISIDIYLVKLGFGDFCLLYLQEIQGIGTFGKENQCGNLIEHGKHVPEARKNTNKFLQSRSSP